VPYNRSEFIFGVEQKLGNSLTRSQKARIDDIAAEVGDVCRAADFLRRENDKRRILRRRIFAWLTVNLTICLAIAGAIFAHSVREN
jgi:hypothetical protein